MRCEVFGQATLYLGDCLEVLPTLHDVDALITDPPYSSGGMVRGDRMQATRDKYQSTGVKVEHPDFTGDNRDQRGFLAWASLWLMLAQGACRPGAMAMLFSDWRQLPVMTDALQSGGFVWRGIVPWDKVHARPSPNRFRQQCEFVVWGTHGPRDFAMGQDAVYHPGILTGAPPKNDAREHPTQKPERVMAQLCEVAPPGGLVLDPFAGSGTTGVAAITTGRQFVGIEKDRHYFDVACRRLDAAERQRRLTA